LRSVFLDRDGVINRKLPEGQFVTCWRQFELLPGVPEAIARLNRSGLLVLIVSNQRGIASGLYSAADVEAIHGRLQQELGPCGAHVDGFYFCPHAPGECNCRKPLPGLFQQALAEFPQIDPSTSVMLGDSLADMKFGGQLGMKTVLITDETAPVDHAPPNVAQARALADFHFSSLAEAVDYLLS